MAKRDFLSIADFSAAELWRILQLALQMKAEGTQPSLSGRSLALIFEKPSLRTRVSFDVAMQQLGGHALYLSDAEVGLGRREPVSHVAQVLSRYVDGIAARTFLHRTVELLAEHASIPVVNALSDAEHPCQALADFLTIYEKHGSLKGLALAYIGDGNNVAASLALGAALLGVDFRIASPRGYELPEPLWERTLGLAGASGARLQRLHRPAEAARGAQALYTDVWTSMGQESEAAERRLIFKSFQVNEELLALADQKVILMHPLPAHQGEEVAPGLLDRPPSVVFDQAENRLHVQKALLSQLLGS
ncbi:MAG: ornithine carbamoyltransferase [Chloroflexi bacterium]|nr:ornithine carbamoyltransferase [Chloroflexota bacterium]